MKIKSILTSLITVFFILTVCGQTHKSGKENKISNFSEFESAMPPFRYPGNPILKHGGWAEGQLQEPCIMENPKDHTKLIMFYAGANLVAKDGGKGAIAKAWAYKSSPYSWHPYEKNPILTPDPTIAFENFSIRLDCVLYKADADEYWIYYTGRTGSADGEDAVGLAICPAGADGYSQVTKANMKKYSGNPVLTATGQGRNDGKFVSQSAILQDGGVYYMYYSYRGKEILPGIRYATSADGKTWVKKGVGDILSRGVPGSVDSRYFEWKQTFKAFNKYIIVWEAFSGKSWTVCMASADSPTGPMDKVFKKSLIYAFRNRWHV